MSIRLFHLRRRVHYTPTTKRGVASALAATTLGVIAAVGGLVIAATHDDRPSSGAVNEAPTPTPEGTSVPPTMVLIPETTTTVRPAQTHTETIRELGSVLRGLYAAARLAGNAPVDPNTAALETYAMGEALADIREQLIAQHEEGIARRSSRDGRISTVQIMSGKITGRTATVLACEVDSDELYETSTGTTVDDEIVVRDITVTFEQTTTGWKVSKVAFDPEDSDGCSSAA